MKSGRVLALVVGCLLVLPGIGMLVGGAGLGGAYAFGRDDRGYFSAGVDRLKSPTAVITAGDLDFVTDPGSPDWVMNRLDADLRLEVTGSKESAPLFVGIGPAAQVNAYLAGVAHDQVTGSSGGAATYLRDSGRAAVAPPTTQDFWVKSVTGTGTQKLNWSATSGRWTAVLMNADGSPGVAADATVGAKAGLVLPLALILLGLGVAVTVAAVLLIVVGAAGHRPHQHQPSSRSGPAMGAAPGRTAAPGSASTPVALNASLDAELSRWRWLVKWFFAIPHFVVLSFLWMAFVVLTVVAGVTILFTGVYPRGLFEFNLGVLRWSWRVQYYATSGGIGTDRYPPFSLGPEPGYPATLDLAYPVRLSHGLVLVKWLLALPHLVIVSVLVGGSVGWTTVNGERLQLSPVAGGLLGLLVLVAGAVLLVTGRYPRALFDLIVGLNRWVYRVIAYAALMTDRYPPFRLDQGGSEPTPGPAFPPAAGPDSADLRDRDRHQVSR